MTECATHGNQVLLLNSIKQSLAHCNPSRPKVGFRRSSWCPRMLSLPFLSRSQSELRWAFSGIQVCLVDLEPTTSCTTWCWSSSLSETNVFWMSAASSCSRVAIIFPPSAVLNGITTTSMNISFSCGFAKIFNVRTVNCIASSFCFFCQCSSTDQMNNVDTRSARSKIWIPCPTILAGSQNCHRRSGETFLQCLLFVVLLCPSRLHDVLDVPAWDWFLFGRPQTFLAVFSLVLSR